MPTALAIITATRTTIMIIIMTIMTTGFMSIMTITTVTRRARPAITWSMHVSSPARSLGAR
jgi:hypothetical protein